MLSLEALEVLAGQGLEALDARLMPVLAGLPGWTRIEVDAEAARRLAHGQAVTLAGTDAPGPVAVTSGSGQLLGIAELRRSGELLPKRWLL